MIKSLSFLSSNGFWLVNASNECRAPACLFVAQGMENGEIERARVQQREARMSSGDIDTGNG